MKRILPLLAASALFACATKAEEPADRHGPMSEAHHAPHIVQHKSAADFETTLAQAQAAIDKRGFKTFAVIDHAAGAASIGQPLRPATLIIFGNPKGGTPVMQAEPLMGLELPLKMLVTQGDDAVAITWRDMKHTFYEYGVGDHPAAEKMSAVLKAIAEEAGKSAGQGAE